MGKYIGNLARSLMGQLKVKAETGKHESLPQTLYRLYSGAIYAQLKRMNPETLGKIAACGKGMRMYEVHCGNYLGKYADGIDLLREIACTAIVAEISDILSSRAIAEDINSHPEDYETPDDVINREKGGWRH